jgi:hypothetical protein
MRAITITLCASALALGCKNDTAKNTGPEPKPDPVAARPDPAPAPTPAATPAKPAPAPTPTKPAPKPETVLEAQLEALKQWADDDGPMQATFAKSAIVLFPNGEEPVSEGSVGSQAAILNPGTTLKSATYDHFKSGSHDNVMWFSADLHVTTREGSHTKTRTIRAIELLDGAEDWKVVVAAFTNVGKLAESGSSPIANATPADVLTKLLVAPDALAAALAPDAVVLGTDPGERGEGDGAKKLLATWHKLQLTIDAAQKTREIHTASYGYAMANVVLKPAKGDEGAMNAFVLAIPAPGGAWSVVAASYGATF